LTLIIHLELNHDTLTNAKVVTLWKSCRVDILNLTIHLQNCKSLDFGNTRAIDALEEEQTCRQLVLTSKLDFNGKLTIGLGLLATAWTTTDKATSTILNSILGVLIILGKFSRITSQVPRNKHTVY